jgi:predicted nucleic acid-binding protein
MTYLDTSFIVPFYIYEASSVSVVQTLYSLPLEEVAVSHWTAVEFASVLARRRRMKEISPDLSDYLFDLFEHEMRTSYQIILPTQRDYDLARSFLKQPDLGLKAGDAFHLAIAKNNGAEMLLTLDEGMLKAAQGLGIPAGKSM